jgi:glutamate dehydrogenase
MFCNKNLQIYKDKSIKSEKIIHKVKYKCYIRLDYLNSAIIIVDNMTNSNLRNNEMFFESVISAARKKAKNDKEKGFAEFAQQLYKFAPATDLRTYSTESLTALAQNIFEFAASRKKGEPAIRIYNPEKKQHGWESDYTIIEIVNDDMPFLVDSVTEEINRHGLKIFSLLHPVIEIKRGNKGAVESIKPLEQSTQSKDAESVIHVQISYISDTKALGNLENELLNVLKAINFAVDDWHSMIRKTNSALTEFCASSELFADSKKMPQKEKILAQAEEIKAFFEWLKDSNFVFLGYAEYEFTGKRKKAAVLRGSELGILKLGTQDLLPQELEVGEEWLTISSKFDNVLEVTKANKRSIIHRPVHMDYFALRRFNEAGEIIGEHRFIGLFTSMVYYQSSRNIPIIRKKIESILQRSGFATTGHSGKALTVILEDFPRDELFQINEEKLFETVMGIEMLSVRPHLRLFMRKDDFERFVSCIIFLPRESMNTDLRKKIEEVLCAALDGTVSNHYTQITDSPLARLQIIIKTKPGKIPNYNVQKIEERLEKAARKWNDSLLEELVGRLGSKESEKIYGLYKNAFSISYQSRFSTEDAYYDILRMEKVIKSGRISFDLYESLEGNFEIFEFKVFNPETHVSLSVIMPLLANMGLDVIDEHTYQATPAHYTQSIWIHRLRFKVVGIKKPNLWDIKKNFETALDKIWAGEIQNDGLNKLILLAGLKWRDSVMVRAYIKYLQQSNFPYSQNYIQEALINHCAIVKNIVDLFYIRFDPAFKGSRENDAKSLLARIEKSLGTVTNLAEDRVLRGCVELLKATLRTNFFQKNEAGEMKDYISFKFASAQISWLPKPKPYAEIFVYSARVEGIHLRGGRVARGGLRWSDRREDFRTEVLGLMKAQMTKNSVIIPVGSKGGFIVKHPPLNGTREDVMKEGIACYKTFLRGLLDITDNLVDGKTKAPKDVLRHDGDDAYLVVAADKGTATFSDYANEVAAEYGFWLGDAFASGGSVGYDHKKMAITARGAWISVARHFREMGVDVDKDDFTVVGIGDMSGDVFGNGMLLSKHIKLVAAFNHMHIFIDPDANRLESFKERKRLFALPRSGWNDYNAKIISQGGGVFERSLKSIKISSEMKKLFHIKSDSLTPDELIKALLGAPVDLLWNGGIGTYVKSKNESNENVGDRANDNLRINGGQLQAKVVGEGGNLGFTQLGRIEYAMSGGRVNTDAIDNSAGVDCSDHEVNIKIALGKAVTKNKLTLKARNNLLETMTEEVAQLVLKDNTLQTQAITYAQLQGNSLLETQSRLIASLEKDGSLDRAIEFLPEADEITRRHSTNKGLTRPEISVVMAYSKLRLYERLLSSSLPDESYYEADLIRYFPAQLQNKYLEEIKDHPLRREIIATAVTNSIINRIGGSMFYQLCEESGLHESDAARAYTVAREVFGLRELWNGIAVLTSLEIQKELFMEIQALVERTSIWFTRNIPNPIKVAKVIDYYKQGVKTLTDNLSNILPASQKQPYEERYNRHMKANIPEDLARSIAGFDSLSAACDIVQVAKNSKLPVELVGKIYFEIGSKLNLSWMRQVIRHISPHSYWQRVSAKTLVDDIYDQQKRLTIEVLRHLCKDNSCANAISCWEEQNHVKIAQFENFLTDIKAHDDQDFSMIVVALRKVKDIYAIEA